MIYFLLYQLAFSLTKPLSIQHLKNEVKGYLYKMAKEVKFFSFSLYYKRYFVLNAKQNCFLIQNEEVAKKVTKVPF